MKRTILTIFCALFSVCALLAQNPNLNPNLDFTVDIEPGKKPIPTVKPRTIVNNDISAHYSYGELFFTFNVNLDHADIVVTNTTTGESWYDGVNGIGSTVITLSGDEGYYIIHIYTDYGEYYGEFTI